MVIETRNGTSGVWFIDAGLMYKAAKEDAQFIQFKKLKRLLCEEFGIPLREVQYFDGAPQIDADRKRHNYLRREGFRVEPYELGRKSIDCPACEHKIETRLQKCVDIALAMSIIAFAAKTTPISYNPIVLSSGDRDFAPVLKKLRDDYDKDVILVAPRRATAGELVALTTKQIWIEDYYSTVAEPWSARIPLRNGSFSSEENRPDEMIPAEHVLSDAKTILKKVWDHERNHEKLFQDRRKGRPWGYMLHNFGMQCARENKISKLQIFLVENKAGQWKGAHGVCLELAKQILPGSEIISDPEGHPYLVQPSF